MRGFRILLRGREFRCTKKSRLLSEGIAQDKASKLIVSPAPGRTRKGKGRDQGGLPKAWVHFQTGGMETWLRPNIRVLLLSMMPLAVLFLVGAAIAGGACCDGLFFRWLGAGVAGISAVVLGICFHLSRLPRLAYRDGCLLLYLRSLDPIWLPVDVVECFFLGQASTKMGKYAPADVKASTVVLRLDEKASDWHHREVKPLLGRWCDGYITIHGVWCEPLSVQRVNELNHKLAEVKRQRSGR